jgi:hypothetical protein
VQLELGRPQLHLETLGDVWDASWADDGRLYVQSDDTTGFGKQPGRNLQFHVVDGERPEEIAGRTINTMDEYGKMGEPWADGCMWKLNGSTCIDGILYAFVSRHGKDTSMPVQTAQNSSLIVSADKGLIWRRTALENYDRPMFPGPRFGSPFFIKYGRNGRARVHGADLFVYALANDGSWDNGNDMILARAPRDRVGALNPGDWQFYAGGDGEADAAWAPNPTDSSPILAAPGRCSMTGAQYIQPLGLYLMIQWHYSRGVRVDTSDTTWTFYHSPAPWGPWKAFAERRFKPEGYYNPCIVAKFISRDGLKFPIFTNGNFATNVKDGAECLYRLTVIPCTLAE